MLDQLELPSGERLGLGEIYRGDVGEIYRGDIGEIYRGDIRKPARAA
jgi:hypothetical protein